MVFELAVGRLSESNAIARCHQPRENLRTLICVPAGNSGRNAFSSRVI